MILVERQHDGSDRKGRQIIALFGAGLIGRSILAAICRASPVKIKGFPFTWNAEQRQPQEFAAIQQYIIASCKDDAISPVSRIDVLWAAGHSGFDSSEGQVIPEVRTFEKVLSFSLQLLDNTSNVRHSFHMISSAGGLFEGQKHVDRASVPRPLRPYGHAKIQQEQLLSGLPAQMQNTIYRPSSVYGFSGKGFRLGFVNTLIQNSIHHRSSNIFGNSPTIRDYVLASDIGQFVAKKLRDSENKPKIYTLASGKPTTIFEMLSRIERILGRKFFYTLDKIKTNTTDISFSPSALPESWYPTNLETGLRQTARALAASSLALT
jgi:UDP-glucose 4-epimerase